MATSLREQIRLAVDKIAKKIEKGMESPQMKQVGLWAIDLIAKRTRLGYGVAETGQKRFKLSPLSPKYVERRKAEADELSELTTPKRSNLTFTGQMIDSLQIIKALTKRVIIGAIGKRKDGKRNEDIAKYVSDRRPWNNLSDLEIAQIRRLWRKMFGDLVKR